MNIIIPYHAYHYRYDVMIISVIFTENQVGRLRRPAIPDKKKHLGFSGGKYLQRIVYIYLQEIHNSNIISRISGADFCGPE